MNLINSFACILNLGGSRRKPQADNANSTQKRPDAESNMGPSYCGASVLTTTPLLPTSYSPGAKFDYVLVT